MGWFGQGTDDEESIADELEANQSPSKISRTQEGSCDNCGLSEGSLIQSKAQGWRLCRTCYNDPEVLGEFVDGE